jgi:hypothetical protein
VITIDEAEEILKKEYHIDNFTYLAENILLPDFKADKHSVAFRNDIFNSVTLLGESKNCNIAVFEVILNKGCHNRRVAITQEMFRVLRGQGINNALVAFANADMRNYRLSLLTSKYEYDGDKIVKTLSNPRRYSYSLGYGTKTKTAYNFLIKKGKVSSLEELIGRFSVEVVNKQFYTEIATAFTELVGGERNGKMYDRLMNLQSVTDHNKYAEFGVRLIGRIMFCWFLREKKSENGIPLVPDDMLSIATINASPNYYHHILEPLFFELLNTNQRIRREPYSIPYYNQIPYLNGGLFSPHTDDKYKYDAVNNCGRYGLVTIPNEWFENLYKVLSEYNFTVDENTAYDIELSIDPEMLGRIFENLLAEINPETGENAKKSTGSFYTPRDIVDHMVDSSLCEYLKNKTGIEEIKLKALISYSKEDDDLAVFDKAEKKNLIDALYGVTVLDPACGSGAFPIGMLQKIVYVLQEIDPDATLWFAKVVSNAPIYIRKEVEKKFSNGELNYIRKITVIEKSIFGIDIQPIAVEISRLRCFLSLIIEEKVDDNEENRGIKPLPNLDFKFIIANSLIKLDGETKSQVNGIARQTSIFENQNHIDDLKSIRERYFEAQPQEKADIREEFQSIQNDMWNEAYHAYGRNMSALYEKLTQWKPFKNEPTDWFDPEWMFGVKNGFDIVIANPPYLDSENMTNSGLSWERDYIVHNYKFTKGNWDIYIAFFELGFNLLSKNGCEIFITPDKWISKPFGTAMRGQIIKNIKSVLFAGRNVFESSLVDSIITLISKKECEDISIQFYNNGSIFDTQSVSKNILTPPYTLDILASPCISLIAKMDEKSNRLDTLGICENACATSDCYLLKNLIVNLDCACDYNEQYLKIINTGTIGRFLSRWGRSEMRYLKDKYLFPVAKREDFLSVFTNSYGSKSIKPKIIIKGLTLLDSCIDEEGLIIPGKSTMIITSDIPMLYIIMGIINAKLTLFYIKQRYSSSSYNGGINFTKEMINSFPIKINHENEYKKIGELSLQITKNLKDNLDIDTNELEREINDIMYEIYGLTPEEIALVENSIK